MTPSLVRRLLIGAVLLLIPQAAQADDAVELRWRFTKGQVFKYLMKHREVRTAAIADQKRVTTTEAEFDLEWTVKDIDDQGLATIEQKVIGLRVSSSGTEWDFQYDSSRGNEGADDYKKKLIHFYDQLRFTNYRLKLKPDGTVAEVHGFDKLQTELGNPNNIMDFEGLNLRDDSFGWFVQQVLGKLPSTGVKKGASWNQPVQQKLAGLGELTGKNEYTLGAVVKVGDRPCQEMQVKGNQDLDLNLKWLGNNLLRGTLKTSKLAGTIRFDAAKGKVENSEVQIEKGGDLKIGTDEKAGILKMSYQHTLSLEAK